MRRLSVGQGTSIVCVGIEESYLGKGLESLLQRVIKGKAEICTIALRNFMGYKKIRQKLAKFLSALLYLLRICAALGKGNYLLEFRLWKGYVILYLNFSSTVLQVKFCALLQHFRNVGSMDSAKGLFAYNFPGWGFGEEGFLVHKHVEGFDNSRQRRKDQTSKSALLGLHPHSCSLQHKSGMD